MSDIPKTILIQAKDPSLKITARIGKEGLTEGLMNEISDQLLARKLIKIKINRGIFERNQKKLALQKICSECNARLIESRGNVAILFRK